MQVSLCDKYGFDKSARSQRLALFGLGQADHTLSHLFQQTVIANYRQQIVDQFYDFLLEQPETAAFLQSPGLVEQLKKTHSSYLDGLGVDFDQQDYFEHRLAVGLVHERIGLPLALYQSAYRYLQQLLITHIPDDLIAEDKNNLTQYIIKISNLDMSLATETYHNVLVNNLTSSIIGLRHEEQRLTSKIKRDTLTDSASREYALQVLEHELKLTSKRAIPTCIAMIDLDHFKKVNDNYGHLVGDEILRGVVGRIRSRMRNLDVIGRFGGEEFLLIFPATDLETSVKIVERIRQHVGSSPFHVDEFSIPVTISAGVTASKKNDTIEYIIERADQLLYQAKNNGRNRVES